jgi:hypothetical protein
MFGLFQKTKAPKREGSEPPAAPERFIMLFVRGSGSTLLADLINQVPGYLCLREPKLNLRFFDVGNSRTLRHLQKIDDAKFRPFKTNRVDGCRYVGGKVKLYDQFPDNLRSLARSKRIKTVILIRRDVGRHAIGLCRKEIAKRAVAWSESERLGKVHLDLDHLEGMLNWVESRNAELEAYASSLNPQDVLWVEYEKLCGDYTAELERVCRHLSDADSLRLPEQPITPTRNTHIEWWEDIANADEVKDCLKRRNLF